MSQSETETCWGCGKMVRKFSSAAALKERGVGAEGGRGGGEGKGMMFLPRCSAGSGWGVEL